MSGILQTLIASIGGAITDTYFNLVTLLLPGNGTNGAQNNTFLDSSTNNFTITRNGNTTQGTFSPFSQTGWSNYFDGTSGQYLNTVANTAFNFGTGDFTVETWVYPTSTSGTRPIIEIRTTGGANGFALLSQSGALTLNVYTNSAFAGASTNSMTLNAWNHVALTRSGNTWTYWINGASGGSFTNSSTQSDGGTTGPKIGGSSTAGEVWIGYISNARITKGGALYSSTFTPSTTPLTTTVSAGTVSLLTCQSNRFIDNSSNAFAITVNGSPSVQAFSPFAPTAAYSAATVGGSGYFDGTGDNLTVPDNAAFDLGSGAFTVEAWVYYTATNNYGIVCGQWGGVAVTGASAWIIRQDNASKFQFVYTTNGTTETSLTATNAFSLNTWNHVVACKDSSNNWALFMNGVRQATSTASATIFNSTYSFSIGGAQNTTDLMTGYVSNVRVVKGTAVYDPTQSTLTVPTAPLTAITNTSLLCNFTNAGITDATAKNDLETVGNAQISTTQSKFGGSSMYFDGTGDWLTSYNGGGLFRLGTVYTIEMWFYTTSVASGNAGLINFATTSGGNIGFNLYRSSAEIVCNDGATGGTGPSSGASSVSVNTWTYLAVVCNGTTTKIYLDGVEKGSYTGTTGSANSMTYVTIGAFNDKTSPFSGYIDDLRVTRGVARTITTPTAAFPVQ